MLECELILEPINVWNTSKDLGKTSSTISLTLHFDRHEVSPPRGAQHPIVVSGGDDCYFGTMPFCISLTSNISFYPDVEAVVYSPLSRCRSKELYLPLLSC